MTHQSALSPTLSELAFDYLRPHLAAALRVPESSIRAEAPLWWLLPGGLERSMWDDLARRSGLRLPRLRPPKHVRQLRTWIAIASAARLVVAGIWLGIGWAAVPLGLGGYAVTFWVLERLSRPFASEFDLEFKTVGDLALWILALNQKRFREQFGVKPNRDEIFITVKAILVDQLGVPPEKVHWEASFVNDLGLD